MAELSLNDHVTGNREGEKRGFIVGRGHKKSPFGICTGICPTRHTQKLIRKKTVSCNYRLF